MATSKRIVKKKVVDPKEQLKRALADLRELKVENKAIKIELSKFQALWKRWVELCDENDTRGVYQFVRVHDRREKLLRVMAGLNADDDDNQSLYSRMLGR